MSRKVTYAAILVALAMTFSYIEVLIPINVGLPGMKLGLANLVVLIGFYILKPQEVFFISLVRILLMGCLFGNVLSLMYSLSGGILSYLIMLLLKNIKGFSIVGISIAGGVSHNIGQILAAILIIQNNKIIYYLPPLMIAGIITGVLIGFLAKRILPTVSKGSQKILIK